MAFYIKANPKVAQYLNLTNVRNRLRGDVNYILFQNDMAAFGPLHKLEEICRQVGALALRPWEAKQEQDGTVRRALPIATDERFVMEAETSGKSPRNGDDEVEQTVTEGEVTVTEGEVTVTDEDEAETSGKSPRNGDGDSDSDDEAEEEPEA